MLKIGTLFSGIGAPEEALSQLKIPHKIQFACDCDAAARFTYLNNHRCEVFYEDVKNMPKELPEIDLLVFGFPCQTFSLAGCRNGLRDVRGRLIYSAIDVLKRTQPKYFIAENVPGLMKNNRGRTFKKFLKLMTNANYHVHHKVLNSLDYGTPQHRRRIWFVGIKKDIEQDFDFPNINKKIALKKVLKKKVSPRFFSTKDFLSKPKVKKRLENYDKPYINCITQTIARNGTSSEYISNVAAVYHAIGQARKPTPEECLRIFGFSKKFKFPQSISITQMYNQLGNTMVVPILKEILCEICMK